MEKLSIQKNTSSLPAIKSSADNVNITNYNQESSAIRNFLSTNNFHNVNDFEATAKRKLPKALYEYLASGSDEEETLRENRIAFSRYALRPFVLRPVSGMTTSVSLFGHHHCHQTLSLPVFASPAGVHRLVHDEGECATARACEKVGTLFALSQHATCSIEEVARAAPGACRWFQCYILRDRSVTASLIERAIKAGYVGIFITVDSVKFGRREADARNDFNALPPPLSLANYEKKNSIVPVVRDGTSQESNHRTNASAAAWERKEHAAWDQNTEAIFDQDATWEDISWLRSVIDKASKMDAGTASFKERIPIIVKGIMTGEDAIAAIEAGVDGIMVSNHGGRQLDSCLASIDALPEVVAAVRSKRLLKTFPVLLDSGVRRGTDVLKALALGATAVGVGKPLFYSLAAGGELGVRAMFYLFKQEIETAIALCGCRTIADISEKIIQRRSQL